MDVAVGAVYHSMPDVPLVTKLLRLYEATELQMVTLLLLTVGAEGDVASVTVATAEPVQPFTSVPVTV